MDEAYSFLGPKLVTLYENAVKKKTHQLPTAIVKKQNDPNKVLNDNDRNVVRGYAEMEEDLPLEPADRKRGVTEFQEDYELQLLYEENVDVEEEEDDVKKEAQPKKKRKQMKQQEAQSDEEDGDSANQPKKKQKKTKQAKTNEGKDADKSKSNSKPKTKPKKVDSKVKEVRDDEFGFDEDEDSTSQKLDPVEEYEQVLAADKLAVSDDEMDDNYDPPSEVEEKEPDYEEKKLSKKGKAKGEKEDRKPVKVEKKKKEPRPAKVLSEEELKKRELKAFRQCEERFCPLLERWQKILVASQDPDGLQKILHKLLPVVSDFSAIFIEAYDISKMLKETRNVLKAKNANLEKCSEVKEAFRESYSSKRPQLPSNLKIRKNVELGKSVSFSPVKAERKVESDESRPAPAKEEMLSLSKSNVSNSSNSGAPRKESSSEGRSLSPKPAPAKKKFSLTNLMAKARVDLEADDTKEYRSTPATSKKAIVLPAWMTHEIHDPSILEDPRALALEFLLDMASFFPSSKVNKESIARGVEAAIHRSANTKSSDWVPEYWKKVHLLVAGICGKLQPTRLFSLVMNGRFETADQLVALPDKKLIDAFEGHLIDF
jgi:hypothetical protein